MTSCFSERLYGLSSPAALWAETDSSPLDDKMSTLFFCFFLFFSLSHFLSWRLQRSRRDSNRITQVILEQNWDVLWLFNGLDNILPLVALNAHLQLSSLCPVKCESLFCPFLPLSLASDLRPPVIWYYYVLSPTVLLFSFPIISAMSWSHLSWPGSSPKNYVEGKPDGVQAGEEYQQFHAPAPLFYSAFSFFWSYFVSICFLQATHLHCWITGVCISVTESSKTRENLNEWIPGALRTQAPRLWLCTCLDNHAVHCGRKGTY